MRTFSTCHHMLFLCRKKCRWLVLLLVFTTAHKNSYAHFNALKMDRGYSYQAIPVSGVVKDGKGNPLIGVTVAVKGTANKQATDENGKFQLKDVPENAVLVFTYIGFKNKEVTVGGKSILNVVMEEATSTLNEVVVVGYGTQTKKDVTGAVSQVKAAQLEKENPATVQDLLRANVPGLNISQTNAGSAKGGGDLQVRGRSSINAGTSPLLVVDGVIYPGQLSDINPNDIATIDVLKDASAAAVYGAKSASGVVIITTKKGTSEKPVITVNTNAGFGELAMNQPLYDGPGFVNFRTDVQKSRNINAQPFQYNDPRSLPSNISVDQWLAYDGSKGDPVDAWLVRLGFKQIEIDNYKAGNVTNWYDMMFQKGFRQDHTVSLSGRNENVNYYMSVGYTGNNGVIVGDKFKTIRTRLNLEGKVANFLSAGINLQYADRDESQVPVNWPQMINASPYGSVYNADGSLRDSPNDDFGNNANPFLDNYYTDRLRKNNTLFGSLYAKGSLPYGFSYQVNFTPNLDFFRYYNAVSANNPNFRARKGIASRTTQTSYNWQIDNVIHWDKKFGVHQFNVTLLANAEKFQSWRDSLTNEGFDPNDKLSYHNIGSGIKPLQVTDDQRSTGDALMARLNYTLMDKYLLTLSIRRDGYSAFGQRNPRASFPAAALGWVFTQESFMKNVSWFNYGKLRFSYGVNGNRDIDRYLSLANLNTGKYQYIGLDGKLIPISQLYVNRLQNPDLKWEQTGSFNIGLDFAVLKSRLSGTVELYQKNTKNVLINRILPTTSGFDNILYNLGEVGNKGFELSLNSVNISSPKFKWNTTVNFTLNRNKIIHLYGKTNDVDLNGNIIGQSEKDDINNGWFIGRDLNVIWDQKVLGVWQQSEAAEAAKYGVRPGDFKVEDVNGDGNYTNADRQFLGYTTPRFQWTLRNEFNFLRDFSFSFMLYSNWGQMASYNQAKNNSGFPDRQNAYQLPYWTPENPINNYARLFSSNGSATYSVYRKTSFIRLQTIALSYSLPPKILDKAKFKGVQIFANVTNIGVYAPDWDFWDPEYRNRASDGSISTSISPRYYSLGLNITL